MRQIHVCAWLLISCSLFAACGGEEFASSDDADSSTNGAPDVHAGGSSKEGDDSGYGPRPSAGSKNGMTAGGNASGGAASGGAGGTASGGAESPGTGGVTLTDGGASTEVECPSGAITFRMLPSPELPDGYFCDTGCGSGWLTITDAEGYTAFSISSACGIASCESCEAVPCAAAACLPLPLSQEGTKLIWTGTYLSKDTCGQNLACQQKACVPPGQYRAKACANISAGSGELAASCSPKTAQACAEVTFDFPAKDTIDLVLKKP